MGFKGKEVPIVQIREEVKRSFHSTDVVSVRKSETHIYLVCLEQEYPSHLQMSVTRVN